MTVIKALALCEYFRRRDMDITLTENERRMWNDAQNFIDEYIRVDIWKL